MTFEAASLQVPVRTNKLEHTEAAGHVRSGGSAGVGSGKCAGLSEDV